MAAKQTHPLLILAVGLLMLLCASGAEAAVIESTWQCGTDNYSNASYWDPLLAIAPYNRSSLEFEVTIPACSGTVSMDLDVAPCAEVNAFWLGEGMTFKVLAGKCYSVIGPADIYGIIWGNGGDFIAPVAALPGCKTRVSVGNGGYVEIGAPTYCATGLNAHRTDYTLLSADGEGSVLDLAGMTELNDGVTIDGGGYNHTIIAENGGVIDLSGLERIIGPKDDETLRVTVRSGGTIRLDRLASVSHAGGAGRTLFDVDADAALTLPALATVSSVQFRVTNGASLSDGARLSDEMPGWTYAAAGLYAYRTNYALLSADGEGSVLDLAGMTELNDGVTIDGGGYSHTVVAQNGGAIDLSSLKKIIGPKGDELLSIRAVNGTIDMSSLQTIVGNTGTVGFALDDGGTLVVGNVSVNRATTITLNDPNDLLIGARDLDLATTIAIANPGHGMLELRGDFTYAHKDETKASFGDSCVFFNGPGPQELEVGGLDMDVFVEELANDNFGYGQMVVGGTIQEGEVVVANEAPAVVFLVDRVDNGNRGGLTGYEEALYLFGKDGQDGLRLLNGSTLYMGRLPVYAMAGGEVICLRDLFEPNEVMIPFDDGYLALDWPSVDDPRNIVRNGGFETGTNPPDAGNPVVTLPEGLTDIDYWVVSQATVNWTHESFIPDSSFHDGERFVDLSSEIGDGAVSQVIDTVPGALYHVWFDVARHPNAEQGPITLTVSAAGASEELALDDFSPGDWQKKTWRFTAAEWTTTLTLAATADPNAAFEVMVDNVVVLDPTIDPNRCSLAISATEGGFTDPNGTYNCPCGEVVEVCAVADPNYTFVRWEGTTVDANKVEPNDTEPCVLVTVDGRYTLTAVFKEVPCILTILAAEGGATDLGVGDHEYSCGSVVPVCAVPDPDWEFVVWEGTAVDGGKVEPNATEPCITVTLDGDYTLQPLFKKICSLTILPTTGGSTDPVPRAYDHLCDEVVQVCAVPDDGYKFVAWKGSAVDEDKISPHETASCIQVTVDGQYDLQAEFEPVRSLTIYIVGEGTVDPNAGIHYYPLGSRIEVCAEPAPGWEFARWEGSAVDANQVDPNATSLCILVTVDDNYDLTAVFQEIPGCKLTISVTGVGSTEPSAGVYRYPCGSEVDVTAVPGPGHHFVRWAGTAQAAGKIRIWEEDATGAKVTVTLDDDYTLQAVFE